MDGRPTAAFPLIRAQVDSSLSTRAHVQRHMHEVHAPLTCGTRNTMAVLTTAPPDISKALLLSIKPSYSPLSSVHNGHKESRKTREEIIACNVNSGKRFASGQEES